MDTKKLGKVEMDEKEANLKGVRKKQSKGERKVIWDGTRSAGLQSKAEASALALAAMRLSSEVCKAKLSKS